MTQRGGRHRRRSLVRLGVVFQGAEAFESGVRLGVRADVVKRIIIIICIDGVFVGSEISWFARTRVVGIHF